MKPVRTRSLKLPKSKHVPNNSESHSKLKICYVLSYRAPDYIRTRSILRALREMHDIDLYEAINTSIGFNRYGETLRRVLEIKKKHNPDVFILGFRGHEIYWSLRFLAGDKPIILDALMSPYASLSREKKYGMLGRVFSPTIRVLEKGILNDADVVLTDTTSHLDFYQQEFSLPSNKLLALPVGAEEEVGGISATRHEWPEQTQSQMNVLFYGSFLPLHGINIILEAASLVRELPICFNFVGGSTKQAQKLKADCYNLGVTRYTHRHWIPFNELINVIIPEADVCLGGPFGNTEQARRVITGKSSQCLALGKPTIIGKIDDDIGFVDKENCLLVQQGNAQALADVLRWAFNQRTRLPKIGEQGRAIYNERLSVNVIRKLLSQTLSDLKEKK